MALDLLFDRKWKMTVGKLGGQGVTVEGLRTTFSIKRTITSEGNNGTLSVYNLSERTRNLIRENNTFVSFSVGYSDEENLKNIFIGNPETIQHEYDYNSADWITTFEATDGLVALRDTYISVSYGKGAKYRRIFQDAVNLLALSKKTFDTSLIPNREFVDGFAYTGRVKGLLDRLTIDTDVKWSIQNDAIRVVKNRQVLTQYVINLTQDTGLIGSPIRVNDVSVEKQNNGNAVPGWEVVSLLQPKAEPGGKLIISSNEIPAGSEFKIYDIEHSGDTAGNDWITRMRVIDYDK